MLLKVFYCINKIIFFTKRGYRMKKVFLTTLVLSLISVQSALADVSNYFDQGLIYAGSKFPQSVAKANETDMPVNLNELKKGESTATNILGLVETGDASINAAARNGGITDIQYVDTKIGKVYIPLLFIPIYVKEIKTIVYGN